MFSKRTLKRLEKTLNSVLCKYKDQTLEEKEIAEIVEALKEKNIIPDDNYLSPGCTLDSFLYNRFLYATITKTIGWESKEDYCEILNCVQWDGNWACFEVQHILGPHAGLKQTICISSRLIPALLKATVPTRNRSHFDLDELVGKRVLVMVENMKGLPVVLGVRRCK